MKSLLLLVLVAMSFMVWKKDDLKSELSKVEEKSKCLIQEYQNDLNLEVIELSLSESLKCKANKLSELMK